MNHVVFVKIESEGENKLRMENQKIRFLLKFWLRVKQSASGEKVESRLRVQTDIICIFEKRKKQVATGSKRVLSLMFMK